jgi:anti-sigma-K factor RskA
LSAVAIGALDSAEAAGVAQHLLECRDCRQELDRLSDVVDLVGFAAPLVEPPSSLRDSVLSSLDATEPVSRIARWRWVASVAAALIIVLLAGNIVLQMRGSNAAAPVVTPTPATTRAAVPLVWYDLTSANSQAGAARGVLCAQETGTVAWLMVQDLPALPANKTYQAWLSNGDQRMNAGTFTVDEEGRGFLIIRLTSSDTLSHFATLGVTEEPKGGSPAPTGDRFLVASL